MESEMRSGNRTVHSYIIFKLLPVRISGYKCNIKLYLYYTLKNIYLTKMESEMRSGNRTVHSYIILFVSYTIL